MPLTKNLRRKRLGSVSFAGVLALGLFTALAGSAASIALAQEQPTVAPSQDDQADVAKTRILQIPKGSYVEVHMTDGRTVEGLLGDVVTKGFVLQTVRKNRLTNQMVRFEEMESVTPPAGPQPRNGKLELTLDRGNMVVGISTGGVDLDVTFRTPPKIANSLAGHVTVHKDK